MSPAAASLPAATAWTRAALVAGTVLAVDQAVKALVTSALERGEREALALGIELVNVRNTGVAFGALQGAGIAVAVVIAVAVTALVVHFARHATSPWVWLPTGLLLGGALGNVVDRVREGAVVDFVKLPHWPAFNVADVAITGGLLALLLVAGRGDGARGPG